MSDEPRAYPRHVAGFLSRGFKPFFLGSALVAGSAILMWAAVLNGWVEAGLLSFSVDWHIHEMIFGYAGGVIAGFALTAVPNWTGRLPVAGRALAALFVLWITGRLVFAFYSNAGAVAAAVVDSAFLVLLAAYLLREIISGRNIRNLPIAGLVTALAASNVYWHISYIQEWDTDRAYRCGLAVIAMLLVMIGGRITPSFTHNWLKKSGHSFEMPSVTLIDKAAMAASAGALVAWVISPDAIATASLQILSAVLLLVRLLRWRGWLTTSEPLVLILHIGYLWLPVSFGLFAASVLFPDTVSPDMAVHSLTAGATGTMTLAVMTRASLGHTGAPLTANALTSAIYVCVIAGALLRLLAGLNPDIYAGMVTVGGIVWSSAFVLFVCGYGPRLLNRKT